MLERTVGRWSRSVVAASLAAACCGCFAPDSGISEEDAVPLAESERVIAEGVASMVVGLVAGTVDELPDWSAGEFVPTLAAETSASWNESTGEWVVRSLEEYEDAGMNGVADFSLRARFLANGTPVRDANESVDRMSASLVGTNLGILTAERSRTEFDWAMELDFAVERTIDGSRRCTGTGGLVGSTVTKVSEREYARGQDLGWSFELALPARSSCAPGTLTGTMGDLHLSAAFDDAGGASWTLSRGSVLVASGMTSYDCGAADWAW